MCLLLFVLLFVVACITTAIIVDFVFVLSVIDVVRVVANTLLGFIRRAIATVVPRVVVATFRFLCYVVLRRFRGIVFRFGIAFTAGVIATTYYYVVILFIGCC